MSKAVLISIKPEWCAEIISGRKTIEVRKTKPKLATPFKCYIYCTKEIVKIFYGDHVNPCMGNDKVIGEFVCHDISTYETEFYPSDKQPIYETITEWNADDEVWEAVASNCDTYRTNFLKNTCMCLEDFRAYLGVGENKFYGWHISDLVIYDKPKELSEFYKECGGVDDTGLCYECDKAVGEECDCSLHYELHLTRPPQSWCYVEEIS